MTQVGDIRNSPYATRSKEYVWSTIANVFPRGITPTDFDGFVEISSCFLVFEGKTEGTQISTGQGACFRRAINAWPLGRSVFVLGQHPPLDSVEILTGLTSVQYGWRATEQSGHNHKLQWSPVLPGSVIEAVADMFVSDAEKLWHLEPETWEARLADDWTQ